MFFSTKWSNAREERFVRQLHVAQREDTPEEAADIFLWHFVSTPECGDNLKHDNGGDDYPFFTALHALQEREGRVRFYRIVVGEVAEENVVSRNRAIPLLLPARHRIFRHEFLELSPHRCPIFRSVVGLHRTEALK